MQQFQRQLSHSILLGFNIYPSLRSVGIFREFSLIEGEAQMLSNLEHHLVECVVAVFDELLRRFVFRAGR